MLIAEGLRLSLSRTIRRAGKNGPRRVRDSSRYQSLVLRFNAADRDVGIPFSEVKQLLAHEYEGRECASRRILKGWIASNVCPAARDR
jgi:hypothetical protein